MEIGVGQVGELVLSFVWRPGLWLAIRHVAMMTDGCRHSAHGAGRVAGSRVGCIERGEVVARPRLGGADTRLPRRSERRPLGVPSFGAVCGDSGCSDQGLMAPRRGVALAFHVEHPQPTAGADQPRTACRGGRSSIANECEAAAAVPW
jgi:hypothetical protein